MALTKSRPSDVPYPRDHDDAVMSNTGNTPTQPAASTEPRRGNDFGGKPASPDTYIKMRFQDNKAMPETWFKMSTQDGIRTFTPSDRSPVVLLQREGDSTLKMYYADAKSNFLSGSSDGMLAEIRVIKRKDSTGMFLGGVYAENGNSEQRLVGAMVGKESNFIMEQMSKSALAEWKARKDAERSNDAVKPEEPQIVAGQELEFGF